MLVIQKCLALLFSLMILGQAYLVKRVVGTWLFPACLFGLFWFGYTFFPLAVLFPVPAQPYAVAFIFLCTVAFSMGSLPFEWRTAFARNARRQEDAAEVYGSPFLKAVFYGSTLASVVFLVLNSMVQDISVSDMIFNLQESAAAYVGMRYADTVTINIYGQLNIVCAYLGAIVGGFLVSCAPTKLSRRLIVVLSFVSPALVMVTQSNKGLLFLCIPFFYAGILVYRISTGSLRLIGRGTLRSLALYSAILFPIVTISFMSRGLYDIDDNEYVTGRIISNFASYAFGHLYAFSDWFDFRIGGQSNLYRHEGFTYGFYTFMPIFRLMGSQKVVPLGYYDEYYTSGDLLTTNIFTMFRGLILDFGFIGCVLFMLLTGLVLHWAFRTMLFRSRPVFSVAVFILMMGYFYSSFLISVLIWNSIYVTFVLLWIVLQMNQLMTRSDVRGPAPSEMAPVAVLRP